MPETILRRVLKAPVYDVAEQTPLEKAPLISRRVRNNIWLKREDLQPVFSFKLRGAYNRLYHYCPARGVDRLRHSDLQQPGFPETQRVQVLGQYRRAVETAPRRAAQVGGGVQAVYGLRAGDPGEGVGHQE